jgi:membrane-bound lytic murein transglycosylase C
MRSYRRAIALITLAVMFPGPNLLMADPFDELENETAKVKQKEVEQEKAALDSAAAAKASASERCLRDTNQREPVMAELEEEELSPQQKWQNWSKTKKEAQEAWNRKLIAKYAQYKGIATEVQLEFCSKLEKYWDDPVTSNKTEWIEYSADLKERRRVDFEKGTIQIEVATDRGAKLDNNHIRNALTALVKKDRAQAFADDQVASAIEERSKREVGSEYLRTAEIKPEPLLSAYLTGKDDTSDAEIEAIVAHMMGSEYISSPVVNSKGGTVHTITVPLSAPESAVAAAPQSRAGAPSGLSRKATAVWHHVDGYATKSNIPKALVLAVIETESAFNPQAKSGVPAYGLMQIVPGSAGLDATQQLDGQGKGRLLAESYLYDSEKNIEIGATYLNILFFRYLKGIENEQSRLYCSVAAYNTGAGNVSKAFIGTTRIRNAFPVINKLTPQQVYDHLIKKLPYEETRHYLERVSKRITKYEAQGA